MLIKKKYTRFPATLRNYDIMKGIIRRYVSEYIKNPHDFIVGANNPDVVMAKDAAVRKRNSFYFRSSISGKNYSKLSTIY